MRAFWSGEIAFGLVTIPAKLYTATKDLTPQFHQLHKECGTRINLVRRCPKCNRDLPWDEIGKGYEVAKGEYALFTKEELAKLDGDDSTGTIEIVEFVDPLKVDLAKVKIRTRTRLALLRPRGRLFSLDMMRFAEELVAGDEIAPAEGKESSDREKQLALHLVDELTGPFDPASHPDEYRSAVRAAVDEKVEAGEVARDSTAGEAPVEASESKGGGAQVIDLAELLSRSIKSASKPGPAKAKSAEEASEAEASGQSEKKPEKGKGRKKHATG